MDTGGVEAGDQRFIVEAARDCVANSRCFVASKSDIGAKEKAMILDLSGLLEQVTSVLEHVVTSSRNLPLIFRVKIKSRAKLLRGTPDARQGWWTDVAAGEEMLLRPAVQSDIDRCLFTGTQSRNPADYMCEPYPYGALVSKHAIETMKPELGVYAAPDDSVLGVTLGSVESATAKAIESKVPVVVSESLIAALTQIKDAHRFNIASIPPHDVHSIALNALEGASGIPTLEWGIRRLAGALERVANKLDELDGVHSQVRRCDLNDLSRQIRLDLSSIKSVNPVVDVLASNSDVSAHVTEWLHQAYGLGADAQKVVGETGTAIASLSFEKELDDLISKVEVFFSQQQMFANRNACNSQLRTGDLSSSASLVFGDHHLAQVSRVWLTSVLDYLACTADFDPTYRPGTKPLNRAAELLVQAREAGKEGEC